MLILIFFGFVSISKGFITNNLKKGNVLIMISKSYNQSHFATEDSYKQMLENNNAAYWSDVSVNDEHLDEILESVKDRRKRIIKDICD